MNDQRCITGRTARTDWPRELFLENLRHCGDEADGLFAAYIHDAADEIERLRAALELAARLVLDLALDGRVDRP